MFSWKSSIMSSSTIKVVFILSTQLRVRYSTISIFPCSFLSRDTVDNTTNSCTHQRVLVFFFQARKQTYLPALYNNLLLFFLTVNVFVSRLTLHSDALLARVCCFGS